MLVSGKLLDFPSHQLDKQFGCPERQGVMRCMSRRTDVGRCGPGERDNWSRKKPTKSMEISWDQWKSHAKCENSGWSILLHPDFGDTLGSFGRIMGNQALLDRQVRDWSCADPENMDNINIILDTYSHYILLIMKPRESSRPTCWDQISVRWSKSLRAKASCAMQVLWLQFALNVGSSGAMSEPCPIQKLWISGRFIEDIL